MIEQEIITFTKLKFFMHKMIFHLLLFLHQSRSKHQEFFSIKMVLDSTTCIKILVVLPVNLQKYKVSILTCRTHSTNGKSLCNVTQQAIIFLKKMKFQYLKYQFSSFAFYTVVKIRNSTLFRMDNKADVSVHMVTVYTGFRQKTTNSALCQ